MRIPHITHLITNTAGLALGTSRRPGSDLAHPSHVVGAASLCAGVGRAREEAGRNPDNIAHVVSFAAADSPRLVIGFEDLWEGGDQDFDDLVFSVNIGARNVKNLISTPGPTALLTMGGFPGMAAFGHRRRASRAALAGS